jgi:N-formylglutamate deformylase
MTVFEVHEGSSSIILSFPHTGTEVASEIWERLNETGRQLADTDWHIHDLYNGLLEGATTVRATFHRYAIDANRDPSGTSLYPGQNTTGLIPLTNFEGQPIWKRGGEPSDADIVERVSAYHSPYHAALAAQINRVRKKHGIAVVYDCHSIRSRIPYLFDGTLPDFNIGTNGGASCDPAIEAVVVNGASEAGEFSHTLNGRFKGGWTTRHYGRPHQGIHSIQMELAQITHLAVEAPPYAYDVAKAERLRVYLKTILARLEDVATDLTR